MTFKSFITEIELRLFKSCLNDSQHVVTLQIALEHCIC